MTITLESRTGSAVAQTITIGSHSMVVDLLPADGGADEGPNPHDLYDAALGACKALTVVWYARKKGIALTDVKTSISRDDSQERQGAYRLRAELKISGEFTDAEFAQLSAVAEKCPVHKLMTTVTTEIQTVVTRQP